MTDSSNNLTAGEALYLAIALMREANNSQDLRCRELSIAITEAETAMLWLDSAPNAVVNYQSIREAS
jgi:hypothetical protein